MKKYITAFLLLLTPLAIRAQTISEVYRVKIGLFEAADLTFSYTLTDRTYAMQSHVATSGLFGALYAYRADYQTAGLIKNDALITSTYTYVSKTKSHTRRKELTFDSKGKLLKRTSAKDDRIKTVEPAVPTETPDAYDLQTVFARVILQYKNNGFCASEQTVFDGKRLYRVTLTDDGNVTMPANDERFAGVQTWRCALYMREIQTDETDMLWQTAAERPVYIYIAKDNSSLMPYPLRIEIEKTPLGRLIVDNVSHITKD